MFIFKYPEIYFALFLTAGIYKADTRLWFIQRLFDLTIFFLIITIISISLEMFLGKIKFKIPSRKILFPYISLIAITLISFIYTKDPQYGLYKLLRFVTLTSAAFFLPFLIFQEEKRIKLFFGIFISLAILMVIDILSGGLKPYTIGFKTAFSSNYLAVGRICGTAILILLFYFILLTRTKLLKLIFFLTIFFLLIGMLLSGGRGPILALIISILTIFIYFLIQRRKKFEYFSISNVSYVMIKRKILFLIPIIILIGIYIFIAYKPYFLSTYNRFSILFEKGGKSALARVDMFKKSINTITEFPHMVTGLGIGGFSIHYKKYLHLKRIYPHNIFLEIWSELGLFGFIPFCFLLFYAFSFVFFNIKKKQKLSLGTLNISLLSLVIFMLINSSVSGDINDNRLLFTWIGTIYAIANIPDKLLNVKN